MEREIRELNQEIREMIREMNREMNREMQELKADIREMKACMKHLSRSASADWNINARCSLDHQLKKSEGRELRLVFANQLPDKIYTRDKIRDKRDEYVQIKLIDIISWETVELDPLSSIEIEIVVLDGNFGSEGNENWTEQEFNAKIVQQRKSKGPLVKGKQNITLRKGVGIIDDLSFSDNSSWKDCGKFRLGARVLQSRSRDQARIKEAISQAFVVNEYRTREYHVKKSRKLDLPSLDDDVSRLKKITKNAECHTGNNIHTVRDVNKQIEVMTTMMFDGYYVNESTLYFGLHILKDCSYSDWEVIEQEVSCIIDDEKLNDVQVVHQGFVGMQNANNHASSSHGHKGGFSTAEEIVPNLASQPLDTSTGYPVNAQGVKSNSNFDQPPTIGVSGRNSSQWNERGFHCSPNYNPLMTQSSQHFPAAQHASNAFDDVRRNAYSNPLQSQWEAEAYNNPTTGSLCHEFPVPHQGIQDVPYKRKYPDSSQLNEIDLLTPMNTHHMMVSSQNNNGPHSHISVVKHASYASDDGKLNAHLKTPEAEAYNNPATGAVPNQSNQVVPATGAVPNQSNQVVPDLTSQPPDMSTHSLNPGWNLSQLDGINFPHSPNSYLMTEFQDYDVF